MRFVVANYGSRHAGMLLTHLFSVTRSNPDAGHSVYWQDMPPRILEALRIVAPNAQFVKTDFDFSADPLQRISSKVLSWQRAASEWDSEQELAFCDSDTLVRKTLTSFFDNRTDVILTAKSQSIPLNSGVVLARGGVATSAFFRAWRAETERILQTPELFAQANDMSQPYGGTDQMALYQMIAYEAGRTDYTIACGEQSVRVRLEPCARLNETNSRPLADEIHVVHYKAGWQRILLDGRPFSRFRPRDASWEMMHLFLQTFSQALRQVNEATRERLSPADFGISWPWYYRAGRFNPPAYAAWRIKEAVKRVWLMATGQLKPGM
jgi:hypothetical protein